MSLLELGDQRLPVGRARGVDLGLDRFGDQREGEPPAGERARREAS